VKVLDANQDGTIHPEEIMTANIDELQTLLNLIESDKDSKVNENQHTEL
jgi:hypothetical protein